MLRDPVKNFLMNITVVKIGKKHKIGVYFEVPFSKGNFPLYKKEELPGNKKNHPRGQVHCNPIVEGIFLKNILTVCTGRGIQI